jgi:putative transposase
VRPTWYDAGPVRRGDDWLGYVSQPQTDVELVALRRSVERGVPYGGRTWQRRTITELGVEGTLRPAADLGRENNEA